MATEYRGSGVYQLTRDGRDHTGRTVASENDVLNLIQGEFAATSRVSVVK